MPRPTLVLCILLVAILGAVTPRHAVAVDVIYALQNSNVLTYDVNPNTLEATLVGAPLRVSGAPQYVQIVQGSTGHFLYILTGTNYAQMTISVYATDEAGVPQAPAVQTIATNDFEQLIMDPNGQFAYAVQTRIDGFVGTGYRLRLFNVDGTTGALTESSEVQGVYSPSLYCSPYLQKFTANASQLLDSVMCSYPDGTFGITYYSRTVSQTGQLGPDVEFFKFNHYGATSDEVRFGPGTINDLHILTSNIQVRIFPLDVFPKPLIVCDSTMLLACGAANAFWEDVTGTYLALQLPNIFQIVKVDLVNRRLVDTVSTLPATSTPCFSPDDRIMYGVSYDINGLSTIQIYGFDFATGASTKGGKISVPKILWNVYPAQRL
jgi:hypothetical protein